MASEPAPRQAELIEKAAWAMWRADGEPTGVAKRDPYRKLARALAEAGLLADPAQTTELADWPRFAARDRRAALRAQAKNEQLKRQRDALSLMLRAMARKLVATRAERDEARAWANCELGNVNDLTAERDERQARIDRALAVCAETSPIGTLLAEVPSAAQIQDRVRAALAGDQPTTEQPTPPPPPFRGADAVGRWTIQGHHHGQPIWSWTPTIAKRDDTSEETP